MTRPLEVIADPNAPTIVTRRFFAAPPALVWEAWTRPELLRRWMGPRHLTCVLYDVDLRVGGGYRFVHRLPDGQEVGFHGTYREISPHHRMVSTFVFEMLPDLEAVDTLTLEARDGGTLATTHTVHASMEARDGHLHSGMEAGMADGYDRLDHLLAESQTDQRITPFFWFEGNAEEAVQLYLSVFPQGKILDEARQGPGGPLVSATLSLGGLKLTAFNAPPHDKFTEAISLMVPCATQREIDAIWEGLLADGGSPRQCGWLRDRFGVAWQIVPTKLGDYLRHPKAMQAMMQMEKLDIATLEAASRS